MDIDTKKWIPILTGYISTILVVSGFLWELYTNYKNKKASITYGLIVLQLLVNIFQFSYNFYVGSVPLYIGNIIIVVLMVFLIAQKKYYDHIQQDMNSNVGDSIIEHRDHANDGIYNTDVEEYIIEH